MIDVWNMARCEEHGLHGERTDCFVCGADVEQIPMVSLADYQALLYLVDPPEGITALPISTLEAIGRRTEAAEAERDRYHEAFLIVAEQLEAAADKFTELSMPVYELACRGALVEATEAAAFDPIAASDPAPSAPTGASTDSSKQPS